MALKEGDKVSVRAGVAGSTLYAELGERMKEGTTPAWLVIDPTNKEAEIKGLPVYVPSENVFDLGAVIEFYNR